MECVQKKLDSVKLSSKQHTTVFLLKEVNNTVAESAVEWDQIKSTATNSTLVMMKLWWILKEAHNHVIVLAFALPTANTLAKHICKAKPVSNIINYNCKIVNFFTSSHIWLT